MVKLVTSLPHLYSLLIFHSVTGALNGKLNDISPDSLDSALSLSKLLCSSDLNKRHVYVNCSQNGEFLTPGNCATYDEDMEALSLFSCSDFQPNVIISARGYVKLPSNLSQLNDSVTCVVH
jgi:hypothetical protein